jgi:hypothetical protein
MGYASVAVVVAAVISNTVTAVANAAIGFFIVL